MSLHPVRALLRTRLVRPRVEDHAAPHRHGLPDATVVMRLKMHTQAHHPVFRFSTQQQVVVRSFPTAVVTLARLASEGASCCWGEGPAPHVTGGIL